jgi:molecular chaperone DnaK
MKRGMPDEKRRDPRVAAELRLRLGYGSMDEFIERYSGNVSRGGIFVRTLEPRPPGTELEIDIALENGDQAIRGRGVVRWTTPPSAPGEPPRQAGMGVRFTELTSESRALVELMVATAGGDARSEEPPVPGDVDLLDLDMGERGAVATPPTPGPAPDPMPGSPAAPAPRRPAPVIGIDLGTTNSCAAVVRNGKVEVLASRDGHRTIPSVVAYDAHGRLLVGHAAKAQIVVNPRHTVYGSKRLVGRPFWSPTVQACRDRFHYEIVEAPGGGCAVRFAGRDYTLQQVSALVLREMKEVAAQALGEPVERAVVTVPAYYNDHQRSAVRDAGALAGLHVERIVNEPTAAALAFGHGRGLQKRVLVYDLGGGTFDASVLEIQGDVYEVVSTGGDTFLGGVDFDDQIVDHLVWRFTEQHGVPPPPDRAAWQRIRDAAEELKIALSSAERATARVPFLARTADGRDLALEVEVTRKELEGLTGRLVDRTLEVCRDVLRDRGLSARDIEEVLLVGGQSRMPLVWRRVAEEFGREPNKSVHPDEAVAIGAALLADSATRVDSVVLVDVLAMAIGVGLPGGRMATVLPRNSALPARKVYEIATTKDGQRELELQVFQGDSHQASECEYLGTLRFPGLPARPRGEVTVSVEFAVGAEGLLEVSARDLASGRTAAVKLATLDTPESLREKLGIPGPQTAPRGARPIPPSAPAAAALAGRKGLFGRLFGGRG